MTMLNGPQYHPGLTSITARDAYRTFAQSTDRNRRCAMAGAIEVRSPHLKSPRRRRRYGSKVYRDRLIEVVAGGHSRGRRRVGKKALS